ncbi:MAG: HEAT repeat domain-containing protein [Pseudomonadota bacterium]
MRRLIFLGLAVVMVIGVVSQAEALGPRGRNPKMSQGASAMSDDLKNELYVVLEKGTRSPDMATRALAVENVALVKAETTKDYVIDALKDPQWIVRRAAIRTLIRLGNPAYRKDLARAMVDQSLYAGESSPLPLLLEMERAEAFELLVEIAMKTGEVLPDVMAFLREKDRDFLMEFLKVGKEIPEIRAYLMEHLQEFGTPETFPLLASAIPSLGKAELLQVFGFLKTLGTDYQMPFLSAYLKSDDDQEVQFAAAEVAAARGDAVAVDILLPLCDDNEVRNQVRCLVSLKGVAKNPDVVERAKMFLYGDPNAQTLYAAYDLLTVAGVEEIYDRIYKQINSTNTDVRATAVFFIGRVQGNRALPTLHDLLADGNQMVRIRAIEAIGELRQAESVGPLESALMNEYDPAVRKMIVKALGNIGDRSVIRVVSFLVTDPTVKSEAVAALAGIHHRDALLTLQNVMSNNYSQEDRATALKALLRISAGEARPAFERALGWLPPGFMEEMAKELGEAFLPHLKTAIAGIHPEARKDAVMAFRFMAPEKELEVLEQALFTTKHGDLKTYILDRLVVLKGEAVLPILETFYKDENMGLRVRSIQHASRLVKSGSEQLDKLKDLLLETEDTVRVAAAAAIIKIYSAGAEPVKKKGKKGGSR